MKISGGLIAAAASLLATTSVARADFGWVAPSPQGNALHAVWGSSATDLWAVGDAGTVIHSKDGGKTWTILKSGTGVVLHGVWGSSAKDVYVVGDNDVLLHTTNGGASFTVDTPKTGYTTALESVWGTSADDVYAVGVNGAIVHTKDRGKTWDVQKTTGYDTLYAVWGSSADDVFAIGESGTVKETQDKGKTWMGGRSAQRSLHALAGTGGAGAWLGVGDFGTLLRSKGKDGFEELKPPAGTKSFLEAIWISGDVVLVAGGDAWSDAVAGPTAAIFRSKDGGKTFTAVQNTIPAALHGLWGPGGKSQELWGVGNGGAIAHSTDGGATWTAQSTTLGNAEMHGLAGAGGVTIAVGGAGQIARSTDAGKTWTRVKSPMADLHCAAALGDVFVAAGTVTVLRSTDKGVTFTAAKLAGVKTQTIHGVAVAGKNAFVGVGDAGLVITSSDGGASWSVVKSGATTDLYAVASIGKKLYAVGDDGATIVSSDAGATWTPVKTGSTENLRGVAGDGKLVVAVGVTANRSSGREDGGGNPPEAVVVRSKDDGATWTETRIPDFYGLFAVTLAGATIYAVGFEGNALVSTDGGVKWKNVPTATHYNLDAVLAVGKDVLLAADAGSILRGR